jgi:hypothetical protein
VSSELDQLADHLELIALAMVDGKPHHDLDPRFILLAADALRDLGGQIGALAKLGQELKELNADSADCREA